MTFHEKSFSSRFQAMGDEAEAICEEVWDGTIVPFGWRRPPVSMAKMSDFIRYMPDFYDGRGWLVEVMGCNGDVLRGLKVDKWDALKFWNEAQRVLVFLWNRKRMRFVTLDMKALATLVKHAPIKAFENDGNKYYELQWDDLELLKLDGGTYAPTA